MKFTNLTHAEHRERAQKWGGFALGMLACSVFILCMTLLPAFIGGQEVPLRWLIGLPAGLAALVALLMIPAIYHRRRIPQLHVVGIEEVE